jgi:outer membrane protein, heavy metal efflux system
MLRSLIVLLPFLVLSPILAAAQEQPLSLREVYDLARERNPMLHASRAAADAVATQEPSAALPPDPEIQLGVMNASLPGLRTDMPGAMLPSVQAMQMVPFPGKLRLGGEIARQSTAMARTATDETWWEVRAGAAMAFYEIYQADRQIAVMEETLDWLRQFEQVATTMYSVGQGRQSDVLRAGVEVARMQADIARMRAMRTAAAARLNAVLDRPAATPVPAVSFAALPQDLPAAAELQSWAEESRPMLERARIGVEQARTREALARRELWPDLTVGVQYGQRPSEMGTERMGSLMLGFSVPVFAGQRQMQMRREAAAMEQMARAERTAARAQVSARIGELLAELDRARMLVTLYRTEVLPLAEANVTSAFSSYRVGRVDFMTLTDAQMTLNQYSQELYALLAEYGRMIAELEMTIGRALPPTTATLGEDA